jgi:hypothetical protein
MFNGVRTVNSLMKIKNVQDLNKSTAIRNISTLKKQVEEKPFCNKSSLDSFLDIQALNKT